MLPANALSLLFHSLTLNNVQPRVSGKIREILSKLLGNEFAEGLAQWFLNTIDWRSNISGEGGVTKQCSQSFTICLFLPKVAGRVARVTERREEKIFHSIWGTVDRTRNRACSNVTIPLLGRTSRNKELGWSNQKSFFRKDRREKNTLSFGHCPNYLSPCTQFGQLFLLLKKCQNKQVTKLIWAGGSSKLGN